MSESSFARIVREIHRRSLWQVLTIYLAASWVVLEVVDHLAERLTLPDTAYGLAFVLLLVGLPICLATAFVQEGTPLSDPDRAADSGNPDGDLDVGEPEPRSPAPARPSTPRRFLTWRNAILGGTAAFALWGIFAAGWMLGGGGPIDLAGDDAGPTPAARSIAVLPFDNLSTDDENAYFADGVHEDVLTQLSKIADLTVISRTSVMTYRDQPKPLAEIGQELGVRTILEGSVRRSGDNVRVTAQLIDTETDAHLWADNFDRGLTAANVFAIQTEIAQRIADALQATLSPDEASRIDRTPTDDLFAYDATLRGREAYRLYTEEGNNEAIRLFRTAIESDPAYAEPWAGIADAFGQRVFRYGYGVEWADSAVTAAERAIDLDPELATAHKALGLGYLARGDLEAGLAANLRAVELDPNYADAINNVGSTYARLGEAAENVRWTRRSYTLQPNLAFSRTNLASAYLQLREYEIARKITDEAEALDPTGESTLAMMARLYRAIGETDEALRIMESSLEVDPDNPLRLAQAAYFMADAGRFERALELTRRSLELFPDQGMLYGKHMNVVAGLSLRRLGDPAGASAYLEPELAQTLAASRANPGNPLGAYRVASAYAAMEQWDAALDWLRQAHEAGYSFIHFVERDVLWDPVRDDSRFQAVLASMDAQIERWRLEIEREETEAGLR